MVVVPDPVGPVAPGATSDVQVHIYTPVSAPDGASDMVDITITSQGDRSKQVQTTLVTTVNTNFPWLLVRLPQIVK